MKDRSFSSSGFASLLSFFSFFFPLVVLRGEHQECGFSQSKNGKTAKSEAGVVYLKGGEKKGGVFIFACVFT